MRENQRIGIVQAHNGFLRYPDREPKKDYSRNGKEMKKIKKAKKEKSVIELLEEILEIVKEIETDVYDIKNHRQ
jgi:hypothetical protein